MARAPEADGRRQPTPTPRPGTPPAPAKKAAPRKSSSPALNQLASDSTGRSTTRTSGQPLPAPGAPRSQAGLLSGRTGATAWGNPDAPEYAQQNLVTLNVDGVRVTVNKMIATQMSGFLHDLIQAGYKPKSVQGFNNRDITGGSGKSNHAYGAAIDIDPGDNPRYVGTDGAHKIDANLARSLAKKWGLFWGGDYKNSKDYMHFEALGAPRTPGSPPGGTAPVITAAAKAAGATGPVTTNGDSVTAIIPPGGGQATLVRGDVSTAGGGTPLPANATAQQIRDRVARDFGYLAAFLDMPEVGPILQRAALEDWDEATLTGALTKTQWWKTTSATSRQWDALNKTDHATARAQVDARMAEIQANAAKTGLLISPIRVHDLAVNSLKFGWNTQQMNDAITHEGKLDLTGKNPNDALSIKGSLKQRAAQYLVPLADSALEKWTLDVVSGRVTQEAFDSYLKEQAKSMFPGMSAAIDSGVTVAQYVDPYKQLAADTLEVPVESINFNDPKWSQALFQTGKDGQRTSMSLADWQRTLRTDPVYGYAKTAKAVDQGAQFADMLTRTFGKVA